nr:zeta-carotene desaturase [Chelidonium majus]
MASFSSTSFLATSSASILVSQSSFCKEIRGRGINGSSFVYRCRGHKTPLKTRSFEIKSSSLDTNVSDMRINAPKGLFPPEPECYRGPKLKVAIIGAGLAGMSTAVELLDQGHEVDIYDSRTLVGGKVGSFVDKHSGNHIEMGLHVFFGCYNNLFRLMRKVGADENLLVKEHTHTFINEGGRVGEVDFRFPIGAPLHGVNAFLNTKQLKAYDKARNALALSRSPIVRALVDPDGAMRDIRNLDNISFSDWILSKGGTRMCIDRLWDPVSYALGFINSDNMSARCMLTILTLIATKTEASLLHMLKGSPDVYLTGPIKKYITDKGGRFHLRWGCREILYDKSVNGDTYVSGIKVSKATNRKIVKADVYVAACDVPGIKRLIPPDWRELEFFDNIYKLVGVPIVTVQLRYNGWVTELQDLEKSRQLSGAAGLDNLLYSPDADFSCFADLALTSPEDYYIEGQGSLLQCLLTPGSPYMPLPKDKIVEKVANQVSALFPSSQGLEVIWSNVLKLGQSLYREGPGNDPFRPDQKTPVKNFFLAGSYTKQDYIDSMEGATLSGRQASAYVCESGEELAALRKMLSAIEAQEVTKSENIIDELSVV